MLSSSLQYCYIRSIHYYCVSIETLIFIKLPSPNPRTPNPQILLFKHEPVARFLLFLASPLVFPAIIPKADFFMGFMLQMVIAGKTTCWRLTTVMVDEIG